MHPLFVIFGCIFIVLGYGVEFLIYLAIALYHEFAHFLVASKLGISLAQTYLTPFGACLKCEMIGQPYAKELYVAVAGGCANIAAALLMLALWWIFPSIYPYTHLICEANVLMASVNFLPCYPLDGGRALYVLLKGRFQEKTSSLVMKILGIVFGTAFFLAFILTLKKALNITLLTLSLFILLGAFSELKNDILFARANTIYSKGRKREVTLEKTYIIEKDEKLFELIKYISPNAYCKFKYKDFEFDEKILMNMLVNGHAEENISVAFFEKI